MAVAFAKIFMAKVETDIPNQSVIKPLVWKRLELTFFHSGTLAEMKQVSSLSKQINTTLQSNVQLKYLKQKLRSWILTYTYTGKGERFKKAAVLDVRTHFKPTETFQYTHFSLCHTPAVKGGFIKGEALRPDII